MSIDHIAIFLLLALAINCSFLIGHCHYDDGVIGKAGLSVIAIAGFLAAYDTFWLQNCTVHIHPLMLLFIIGVFLFIARHTRRFLKALKRNHPIDETGLYHSRRVGDEGKPIGIFANLSD